jgi:hypothetical protein
MIHHVQRTILDKLSMVESARFGQLKPDQMDGNMFTYHIRQLIATKYVTHSPDGRYQLTQKGKAYIVHRYEDITNQAHTILLLIVLHEDKVLMRKRLVQPMLEYSGFIHGEPDPRKTVEESAHERMLAKTRISVDFSVQASGLIRIFRKDILESFSHAIVLVGKTDTDKLEIEQDQTGKNYWLDSNKLDVSDEHQLIPSCKEIFTIANDEKSHWFDLTYTIDE